MPINDLISRLESGEPVSAFTVRRMKPAEATVAEIREAIAEHPDHPVAAVFRSAIEGLLANQTVCVEHADLLALATNREVIVRREVLDGAWVVRKEIGGLRNPPSEPLTKFIDAPGMSVPPAVADALGDGDEEEDGTETE